MDLELENARTAVRRGAEFLDYALGCHNDGWRTVVDGERLDMDDPHWCILGQLFPAPGRCSFTRAQESLGIEEPACFYFGFLESPSPVKDGGASHYTLGRAWRELLADASNRSTGGVAAWPRESPALTCGQVLAVEEGELDVCRISVTRPNGRVRRRRRLPRCRAIGGDAAR